MKETADWSESAADDRFNENGFKEVFGNRLCSTL
jgi:hypothetical protein